MCFKLLFFTVPIVITTHPQPVNVSVNQTVTLSCKATGSNPIRYQWRRVNGEITSDRANGVNTSTLTTVGCKKKLTFRDCSYDL